MNLKSFVLICSFVLSPLSFAHEHDDHNHEGKDTVATEIFAGHVHNQANIQIIQTQTTFLFEIDFPAEDLHNRTQATLEKLLVPSHFFSLQTLNETCELDRAQFDHKDMQGGHADIIITFEFQCTKPIALKSITLNPIFSLPVQLVRAKTNVIIGDQILPPVTLTKNNAFIKLKKK